MSEDKNAESGDMPNGKPFNEALLKHFIEEDSVVRAYVRSVTRGHRETDDVIQAGCRVLIETCNGKIIIHSSKELLSLKGFLGKAKSRHVEQTAMEAGAAKRACGEP